MRSKTLRRMKVWGESVSRSATHLYGVPSAMYCNLVVNETSSRVTVPPTRQGPCSDSARPGPTPEAISKTSWLWSAGASEN